MLLGVSGTTTATTTTTPTLFSLPLPPLPLIRVLHSNPLSHLLLLIRYKIIQGDPELYVKLVFRIAEPNVGPNELKFGTCKLWNLPLHLPKFHCNYLNSYYEICGPNTRSSFARFV